MIMKKVAQRFFACIDNDLYHADGDWWWQEDSPLHLIQCSVNPARLRYFNRILSSAFKGTPQGKTALEVGCGGGLLSEELARMGFAVTGIDPSEHSLRIAAEHAKASKLRVHYVKGTGEILPYRDNSFDSVFCCDVLEHVRDVPEIISEISRVLRPGGVFCYDTFNRTFISKLVAINIAQDWKWWAFVPPKLHVWEMFIKPCEIKSLLGHNYLEWQEHRGMEPNVSYLYVLHYLRQRARGRLSYKDLGERLYMVESENMNVMYMGYAVKRR